MKLVGPTLLRCIGHGLQAYEKGASLEDALSASEQVLKKGLKRKLPAAASTIAKSAVKQNYKENPTRQRHIRCVIIMRRGLHRNRE